MVEFHLPEHIKEGDQLIKRVIIPYSHLIIRIEMDTTIMSEMEYLNILPDL